MTFNNTTSLSSVIIIVQPCFAFHSFDWPTVMSGARSTKEQFDIFMNTYKEAFENTVSIVNKHFPRATPLNKESRRLCVAKRRAWKAYSLSRSIAHKRPFNLLPESRCQCVNCKRNCFGKLFRINLPFSTVLKNNCFPITF